ncbi:hypothetical protein [Nocardia transvalensis]|uniref:hypothetical protein n=1 Tax=Nocardia transvalensis TaxID=37333 RepID=UPI001892E74A|nr:hypothetical protein [Nocardia transvalensis]MBF6332313.1 hypothetical protein [Nocardia transvalensis]
MAFTEAQTIALVSLIAGFDNRVANDAATRAAWGLAARDQGWEFTRAVEAVGRFYTRALDPNESLPRIAPGHITKLIRMHTPAGEGPRPAGEVLALRGPGSSPEHRQRMRERINAVFVDKHHQTSSQTQEAPALHQDSPAPPHTHEGRSTTSGSQSRPNAPHTATTSQARATGQNMPP